MPDTSSEENKILMDLLHTDSEAGKEALRKKYLKIIEADTKKKEVKTVNPELYNRVSLSRNTAQFQSVKPKIYSDFYELSLAYQDLKSKVDFLEKEVSNTRTPRLYCR